MEIKINDILAEKRRCLNDLLIIYHSDTYMNIKGYLQKLVDLLYHLGYYKDNETLFPKGL